MIPWCGVWVSLHQTGHRDRVADVTVNRHVNAGTIICVNDPYDYENSTKDDERHRRAKGYGQIPNEFFPPDGEFPSRPKLARLLSIAENKMRLQSFTLKCLKAKLAKHDKNLYFSVGQSCMNVRTGAQEQHLQFHQAEADTIMFSIHDALRSQGIKDDVIFDTKDTDNYVAAAYQAHLYPERMGIKCGNKFIDCRLLVEPDMVHCVIPLHVMSGCDQVSGFFGKGKSTMFNKIKKSTRAKEQLEHCGEDEELEEECVQELLSFTRETVYGDYLSQSMGEARARKWRSQKKKSISRLPPDEDSARYKIQRSNYQAYLMRNPDIRDHPTAVGKGWEVVNGVCRPHRYSKPALPENLNQINLSTENETDMDQSNNDDTEESDNDDVVLSEGDEEYNDIDIYNNSDEDSLDEDTSDVD